MLHDLHPAAEFDALVEPSLLMADDAIAGNVTAIIRIIVNIAVSFPMFSHLHKYQISLILP